jgi:hypothetical protein
MNMKRNQYIVALIFLVSIVLASCTKLDKKIYSVTPIDNFWQTPDQIAAGIAPAYQALQALPDGPVYNLNELTSDEMLAPTRGGDWDDGGIWRQLWQHTWNSGSSLVNDAWSAVYNGIGKINFILYQVNNLTEKPANIDNINAELKTLRAYFYFLALDLYGNVPLVTDYKTDANSVTNSTRQQVFDFIEQDIKDNIELLSPTVDYTTYGRVTKWFAFTVLAKLYLNAEVYTGSPRWEDCMAACDSVILSGKYQLESDYFANFAVKNETSAENIFVIPFDNINIGGNGYEMDNLHYQSQATFQLSGGPYNGFCTGAGFYYTYDTNSVYSTAGTNTYRTFLDARTGQFLVGQQFSTPFTYPPNKNVLYASTDASIILKDAGTGLNLSFYPGIKELSNSADSFRLAGVRSIKYFPEAGTAGDQSNDVVIYRLADVLLTKAEAEIRNGTITDALDLVNWVRERAYGNTLHDWTMVDLTLDNILAERGRELAYENFRRQDLIRFGRFGNARVPDKAADPSDGHLNLFPIPDQQRIANPNLAQNSGY